MTVILSSEVSPSRTLYYLGGMILDVLRRERIRSISVEDLRLLLSGRLSHELSYAYYILALDWLFLIGAIHPSEDFGTYNVSE